MTMHNALEGLATESKQDASLEALTEAVGSLVAMLEMQARQSLMEQPRDLQYARTVTDAMRVNVENVGYQVVSYVGNTSLQQGGAAGPNATWQALFSPSAIFMVDEREQQRVQTEQQFNQVRAQRWSFS